MPIRKRRRVTPLPLMMAELTAASYETMARRSLMITSGTCSPAEYSRMVLEKLHAWQRSAALLARSGPLFDPSLLLAPWHRGATANARRLRRK